MASREGDDGGAPKVEDVERHPAPADLRVQNAPSFLGRDRTGSISRYIAGFALGVAVGGGVGYAVFEPNAEKKHAQRLRNLEYKEREFLLEVKMSELRLKLEALSDGEKRAKFARGGGEAQPEPPRPPRIGKDDKSDEGKTKSGDSAVPAPAPAPAPSTPAPSASRTFCSRCTRHQTSKG